MNDDKDEDNFAIISDTYLRDRYGPGVTIKSKNRVHDVFAMCEAGSETRRFSRSATLVATPVIVPQQSSQNCLDWIVIKKGYFPKSLFDFFIALFVGYSCFTSIFYVAFGSPSDIGQKAFDIIVEIAFLVDLLLNFIQEYDDPATLEPVRDLALIAKRYLSFYFWFDIIALIPIQYVNEYFWALKLCRMVHIHKLISFIDSAHFNQILRGCFKGSTKDEQVESQYFILYVYKIFRLLLIDVIITYFLAILLYIVSDKFNPSGTVNTFITNEGYDLKELSVYERVVRCMYFIMTTLTTVGYGDYYPLSNAERIYIIFVQLIGVSFYSYIMGNFIEVISSYEKKVGIVDKGSELENWLTFLTRFNANKPLDKNLVDEIEDHFKYFWHEYKLSTLSPTDPYLNSLPKYTRYYIIIKYLFDDIFWDFRHFFNVPNKALSKFLYDIAFGFLPRIFKQGSVIYKEDEDVEELYLIRKGAVSVGFTLKGQKYPAKELGPKTYFGDYYIFENRKSEFYYEARTDVEAIGITKAHFLSVLEKHKAKGEEIKQASIERYLKEIRADVVETRKRVLKKYNTVNPYESITIVEKTDRPALEPNKKTIISEAEADTEAGKIIEEKLENVTEELADYNKRILDFTEKYNKAFEKLTAILENPVEAGLNIE